MNIDWSKAPEATHYAFAQYPWHASWYIVEGDNIAAMLDDGEDDKWSWRPIDNQDRECILPHLVARPVEPAAPAWNGEGLPPAETVCEYSLTNGGVWHECTIKYVLANGKQLVADCAGNPDGEAVLHVNTCQFRTLRTPEQIAADKRAADIEAMRADIGWKVPYLGPCPVTLLYDAGYRKQVAP